MKIGIPRAMLYYRFRPLWETFFQRIGCEIVLSAPTNPKTLLDGSRDSPEECCLPAKIFMGHVRELAGKCEYIFVPRFEQMSKNEEFCARFMGLPDVVGSTFRDLLLLRYDMTNERFEHVCFDKIGRCLGKSPAVTRLAYIEAVRAQNEAERRAFREQEALRQKPGLKVLIAAQPYLMHDPYIGGPIVKLIEHERGIPLFSDRCNRRKCLAAAAEISPNLFWTMNKESAGAVSLNRGKVNGVILLTAFPCGPDAMVNELLTRKIKDVPMLQLVLDDMQGEAGLQTRIESFFDVMREREMRQVQEYAG